MNIKIAKNLKIMTDFWMQWTISVSDVLKQFMGAKIFDVDVDQLTATII